MIRRRTLQLQLTLLYAVPFMISGALLLAIPLVGMNQTQPAPGQGGGVPHPVEPNTEVHPLLGASALGYAVMVVVSLLLGWFIAGRFLRPLRVITATARDISATNLHRRLGIADRKDEFAELAHTLDDLFERLQHSFDAQRHFVANASHELRTPLTAERALLQVALADPDADTPTLRAACEEVLALGRHQERLIAGLLTLATSEQGVEHHEPIELADVTARAVRERRPEAERLGLLLQTDLAQAPVTGDPALVESLIANLLDNALRYNTGGGEVRVTTAADDATARVVIENSGPVVPPEQIEGLFEPFRRLGRQRLHHDGHGLGLAIVRAIASAHGARVHATARAEGGLHIEVTFPGDPARQRR
ncbi:sensor histidine kinase [Catellatospora sichuanensis]|uniref:sensor histidine kinase n=1 Tax=Catellatospora sichuanensis TaxID=1969805 RepID=UPI001FEAD473|nr:HAMP domain-containing sensor histidine kinase [Catellatospora sichuanensis]